MLAHVHDTHVHDTGTCACRIYVGHMRSPAMRRARHKLIALSTHSRPQCAAAAVSPEGDQECLLPARRAAFKWIHDNIANFGGDPNRPPSPLSRLVSVRRALLTAHAKPGSLYRCCRSTVLKKSSVWAPPGGKEPNTRPNRFPAGVTIFGESAGSGSVTFHTVAPKSFPCAATVPRGRLSSCGACGGLSSCGPCGGPRAPIPACQG